ncbi:MAG: ADOP family duplicated permease [Cyanobacteria bacterium]|nr:ADOP family duplicated permease [Cyanobacteriota bacterium]
MVADLRLAVRGLTRHKTFTLAAVITLALGIGASTAIFTVVYGVLLRPLPFSDPDRIVRLVDARPGGAPVFAGRPFTNVTYHAWTAVARTIGPIESYVPFTFTAGLREPTRIRGAFVSAGLLQMLGVAPQRGRFFEPADGAPGTSPAVVLSDALWAEYFGRNEDAVGRTLTIDGRSHLVVGIAANGFAFPERETRMWVVTGPIRPPQGGRIQVTGGALARLAPGATAAAAAAEGTQVARSVGWPKSADFFLGDSGANEVRVQTLADELTGNVRPALLLMAAGVGCLLLMACANVANLLLSRGVAREREFAVRVAMGAGRWRLTRQMISETILISGIGGVFGLAIANMAITLLPSVAPEQFPRLDAVQIDWRAYAFAFSVSIAAGIIAGVVPAHRGGRPDLLPALRESTASTGTRMTRIRRILLATEAALAVMLLVAAMLLGRTLMRLLDVDPGFDRQNVLTTRVHMPRDANSDPFLEELLTRLRGMPSITAAGAGNMMPLGESAAAHMFTPQIPGRAPITVRGRAYWVTPGYAEAVGLRLRNGRLFNTSDLSSPLQSMLVNEEFVRTALGGVEPLGLQIPSMLTGNTTAQIVGIVSDVLKEGPAAVAQPEVYIPAPAHKYSIRGEINLVIRTADDAAKHAAAVRSLVRELRSDAAIDPVVAMSDKVMASVAQPRFAAFVLSSFAFTAVTLSAVGLYGVLAFVVARRQRELGVRSALGAPRTTLVGMVVREGMTAVLGGVAAGIAGAAAMTRLMQALLGTAIRRRAARHMVLCRSVNRADRRCTGCLFDSRCTRSDCQPRDLVARRIGCQA